MTMICKLDGVENKRDAYREEDCMKTIINFDKKKVIPLANEEC